MLVTPGSCARLANVVAKIGKQAVPQMRKYPFPQPPDRAESPAPPGRGRLTDGARPAERGGERRGDGPQAARATHTIARLEGHVIAGQTAEALDLCRTLRRSAWSDGAGANDALWTGLIVPLIRRLEAAWTVDTVSFTDLTTAFMTLRRVISALSADMLPVFGHGNGRVLVATVPGEAHQFGPQILADLLRSAGWEADLMLDVEAETLLRRVDLTRYVAIALSVGHDEALVGVADLIGDLRASSRSADVCVMVGGPALVEPRAQYDFLCADLVALSGAEAVNFLVRHRAAWPVA